MENSSHQKGRKAEKVAVSYLESHGCKILKVNYRGGGGEADIIALRGNDLVVVEVKSGRGEPGRIAQAVSMQKRRQIEKAAMHFIFENQLDHMPVYFEILAIEMPSGTVHHFDEEFFDW